MVGETDCNVATMIPFKLRDFCKWDARPGWLILLPSRTAPEKGGIIMPESETKKTNAGICIAAGTSIDKELFLNKECFFANHTQYSLIDTETDYLLYILDANKVLMTREPPEEIARFSREKDKGFSFESITHDQKEN